MAVAEIQKETTASYDLVLPEHAVFPVVVDSPHSWHAYPVGFNPVCKREDLLTSWDAWVDELFGTAVDLKMPLLSARFPRFYLDLNRARDDIDPTLVDGDMPFALNPTAKTEKGFGLLRRNALPGVEVYDAPIPAAVLLDGIETYYDPYHVKLTELIDRTFDQFGKSVHLDCHSMKSVGNAMNDDNGAARPDIVVSDNFGKTADPEITRLLAETFEAAGLRTQINDPYKGAELICRHGQPDRGRHSIQIELNRALYMDEARFEKSCNFQTLQDQLSSILEVFGKAV